MKIDESRSTKIAKIAEIEMDAILFLGRGASGLHLLLRGRPYVVRERIRRSGQPPLRRIGEYYSRPTAERKLQLDFDPNRVGDVRIAWTVYFLALTTAMGPATVLGHTGVLWLVILHDSMVNPSPTHGF